MKFSFYLDCRRLDDKQPAPLKLRLSHKGTSALISLGINLLKNQWNETTEKVEQHTNKLFLNNYILRKKLDCEQAVLNMNKQQVLKLTAPEVKKQILLAIGDIEDVSKIENLFVTQFKKFIDTKSNKSTIELYEFTLKRLHDYCKNLDTLNFDDIDFNFLSGFEKFLEPTASKKNGRNIHFRNIRSVFNYAIDNNITTAYPFRRFKIRPVQTAKRALSIEQFRKFIRMPCEEYLQQYKDMFLLSFYLIGINTIDLVNLTNISSDNRIEYDRAKTHKHYSIFVEPEAKVLIEKYKGENQLLDMLDRYGDYRNYRKTLNKNLKRFGDVKIGYYGKKTIKSEFPFLTSYWCRHTWATLAAELDIPKETIAKALGHGGNTITDIYIDFDLKKVDEANRKVINYLLYNEK